MQVAPLHSRASSDHKRLALLRNCRAAVAGVRQGLVPEHRPIFERIGSDDAALALKAVGCARIAAGVDDPVWAELRPALGERPVVPVRPALPELRAIGGVHSVERADDVHGDQRAVSGKRRREVHHGREGPQGPTRVARMGLNCCDHFLPTRPPRVRTRLASIDPLAAIACWVHALWALRRVAARPGSVTGINVERHDIAV
mmetsp:Transcript_114157/g.333732  ORF Transcript_114157/g.333732 Transcript_114157/m.333732 type:complete len:201 (-) Transcript_114157:556-1158(-)